MAFTQYAGVPNNKRALAISGFEDQNGGGDTERQNIRQDYRECARREPVDHIEGDTCAETREHHQRHTPGRLAVPELEGLRPKGGGGKQSGKHADRLHKIRDGNHRLGHASGLRGNSNG